MAIPWPASVPQFAETWNETELPVTIRTTVDVGPPKVRRRYTSPMSNISVKFVGVHDDWIAMKLFFDIDTQGGVLFHQFYNPITNQIEEFRFINPPSLTNISSLGVEITCEWERFS